MSAAKFVLCNCLGEKLENSEVALYKNFLWYCQNLVFTASWVALNKLFRTENIKHSKHVFSMDYTHIFAVFPTFKNDRKNSKTNNHKQMKFYSSVTYP